MDTTQAQLDWLQLAAAEGIGPRTIQHLLRVYGTATNVVHAAQRRGAAMLPELVDVPIATRHALAVAIRNSQPGDELERLRVIGGRLVTYDDPAYPPLLMLIPDPPAVLRVAGDPAAMMGPSVAVVGTRRCSPDGVVHAGRFGGGLASCGVTVCSGGARGIDAEAHRGCLRADGRTVAVLGSGLGQPYPAEHRRLFDEVRTSGGALVSEYPMDRPPRPSQFPRRNRLISGMSHGVLVVEAPVRSGAMLTARMAVESHGRECWSLPWASGHVTGRGGNEAIRDGWSAMAIDVSDVMGDLPTLMRRQQPPTERDDPLATCALTSAQLQVVTALRRGSRLVGELLEQVALLPADTMRAVSHLEQLGIIARRDRRVSLTPSGLTATQSATNKPVR